MTKTYLVTATCYSACGEIKQYLGLTELGGFSCGLGAKNFETPFRGIAKRLCLSYDWGYFESFLNRMTPHPFGEKTIGKVQTELWEKDADGDRIIATYVIYDVTYGEKND